MPWNPFKKEKHEEEQYAPPPGPPPSHMQGSASQHASGSHSEYAPPPGPPPSHSKETKSPDQEPPPYHDWTVIPDTALLPPPPPLNYDTSPTANASAADGEAAFNWCNTNPLRQPHQLTPAQLSALAAGHITLERPACYTGELLASTSTAGRYKCRTHSRCRDSSLQTTLPLYSALAHSPLLTERPKTIYFELRVLGVGGINGAHASLEEASAGIALGYVAPPYPLWRLPGWQRGSLGVHGDDGRRYVNDTFGGVDFTTAFQPGETVGLGMTFSLPANPPAYGAQQQGGGPPRMDIDVFFTRGGKRVGGWDLHEELDERAIGGTEGLEGERDVFGAVGVFGGVDFEVFLNRQDWLYKPEYA